MSSVHLPPSPSPSGQISELAIPVTNKQWSEPSQASKKCPGLYIVIYVIYMLYMYTIHFRRSVFENMVSQCFSMLLDDGGKPLCWCYHGPPCATITITITIIITIFVLVLSWTTLSHHHHHHHHHHNHHHLCVSVIMDHPGPPSPSPSPSSSPSLY